MDEYGNEYERSCSGDFEDKDFWEMMREEAFWQLPENAVHYDFYMFWDEYHFGSPDQCEWKDVVTHCEDFMMLEGECRIEASYSPCVHDHFFCTTKTLDSNGQMQEDDCTEDFTNVEFWSAMREEEWWFFNENAEYLDFYEFWQEYHFGNYDNEDDDDHCEWKDLDLQCSEFNMLASTVEMGFPCKIAVSYSPCVEDEFFCEIIVETPMGDQKESCVEDFLNPEFWQEMKNEPFWYEEANEQYSDFWLFWDTFHNGAPHDCQWRDIHATCDDFTFAEGDQCTAHISYSPCETNYFRCDLEEFDEEYQEWRQDDCVEDFTDPMFWATMRQEQFWQDGQDRIDFWMFWEQYHGDIPCEDMCEVMDCSNEMMPYCEVSACVNPCDVSNQACTVDYTMNEEDHRMSCDDFENMFSGDECVYMCSDFDCAAETGFHECTSKVCFETCAPENIHECELEFVTEPGMEKQKYDCDDFEDMYADEDDETCEDVILDFRCEDFDMFRDVMDCQISGRYNRCDDTTWECTVIPDQAGLGEEDCTEDFEDPEFWI